ncbi:tRNA (adenosine(37)-N6)-threonylcarbamoyltransferase complex ATPase subunit type 1 TsaE [Candidatus Pelagibacter sp.]|nr:tRNA (adenosine(37)-N6)-threonylcarbamoyltransferase complex ATPase subunit type 1 TsaE [Candidatus Pelagibacter sp.]
MPIATKSSKIDISLEKNTESISKKFSNFIKKGDIIFFYGEIGVGKTTFIKHLINNLQSKSELKPTEVPSPTFNIVNEYKIGEIVVNHYDLFKIKDPKELYNIGIFEDNSEIISLVEWPEIISDKPKKTIELYFSYEDDFQRRNLKIFSEDRKEIINEFK